MNLEETEVRNDYAGEGQQQFNLLTYHKFVRQQPEGTA
jgi:hypothetical protein